MCQPNPPHTDQISLPWPFCTHECRKHARSLRGCAPSPSHELEPGGVWVAVHKRHTKSQSLKVATNTTNHLTTIAFAAVGWRPSSYRLSHRVAERAILTDLSIRRAVSTRVVRWAPGCSGCRRQEVNQTKKMPTTSSVSTRERLCFCCRHAPSDK